MELPERSDRQSDGLDELLGELAALDVTREHTQDNSSAVDLDDILAEISAPGTEAAAAQGGKPAEDLDDILGEFLPAEIPPSAPRKGEPENRQDDVSGEKAVEESTDGIPVAIARADAPADAPGKDDEDDSGSAGQPETPAPDDLDDILGELAAVSVSEQASQEDAPADDSGDIVNATGQAATENEAWEDKDLADAVGSAPETMATPAEPAAPGVHAVTNGSGRLRLVAKALAALAVLGGTNGMSYYLGTKAAPAGHAVTATRAAHEVKRPVARPAKGPARYVGLASNTRIGGKTIFEDEEIRTAIEQLDGGMDLQRDIETAARRFTSVAPILRRNDVIEVMACKELDCERNAIKLQYNTSTKQVTVCTTKPYVNGGRISYAFSRSGFREVPGCLNGVPAPVRPSQEAIASR